MRRSVTHRLHAVLLILTLLLNLSVASFAATGNQQMKITYTGIKININGTEIVPRDAGGNVVYPFVSAGTTYLPLRAVASAFQMGVSYDSKTHVVSLTTESAEKTVAHAADGKVLSPSMTVTVTYCNVTLKIDGKATEIADSNGTKYEPFIFNGTVYLPVRALANTLGKDVRYDSATNTAFITDKTDTTPLVDSSSGSGTVSTPAKIAYYSGTNVPMLENIINVPYYYSDKDEDGDYYHYDVTKLGSFQISDYGNFLEQNGFAFLNNLENDDGSVLSIYVNDKYGVGFTIIKGFGAPYFYIAIIRLDSGK